MSCKNELNDNKNGLGVVSASEDVIGDLPSPGLPSILKNWYQSRTKEKEEVGTPAGSVISMCLSIMIKQIKSTLHIS